MSIKERPFEFLRKKDGSCFSEEIIRNWYIARAFVLHKLKDVGFKPTDSVHLHAIVIGDTPLMLSVVRQVALSAHYINHNEDNEDWSKRNRTVITVESEKEGIIEELCTEEYLCNLPRYCAYSVYGSEPINKDSYIDIELGIVKKWTGTTDNKYEYIFTEEDINQFLKTTADDEVFMIDTQMAILASKIYDLGEEIKNLPAEDIHCAKRYSMALDVYDSLLKKKTEALVKDKKWKDAYNAKEGLSNVFCADCFHTRSLEIEHCLEGEKKRTKKETRLLWEANNQVLSRSEHARWVVEKLIMGYRPMNRQERLTDESLFGDKKTNNRKSLKRKPDPTHIDLCSYADLRRINPDNMKYDSFLMLAIPKILTQIGKSQ